MQKFVRSLPELTRVSYLRRNERCVEVSFSFYDSSMIMISGRPYKFEIIRGVRFAQARSRRRLADFCFF